MIYLLAFLGSYFIGGIPFGYIVAKIKGVDIRNVGSGNIGATNVLRSIGKKEGILVFILDFLKGFLPVIFFKGIGMHAGIISAVAAVLGHTLTPYLKFKGGKGVATGFGAFVALLPLELLSAFGVWIFFLLIFGFASLGSILAAISLPIFYWVYKSSIDPLIFSILIITSIYVIYRHRANIKRLIKREEPKIWKKKGVKK